MHEADWGGPYVSMFVCCEGVSFDHDAEGLLPRIDGPLSVLSIDKLGDSVAATLVVGIAGGIQRGNSRITAEMTLPRFLDHPPMSDADLLVDYLTIGSESFTYTGGPNNYRIWQFPVEFVPNTPGIHWIALRVGDRFMTRIPLTIEVQSPIPRAFLEGWDR